MTLRIDVIRLAGDAGFGPMFTQAHMDTLTRLVDLAQSAEREKWINGAAIRVPTATMEQELQTQYRMGHAAGVKDEREACAKLAQEISDRHCQGDNAGDVIVEAIRARGTP